jgi:hypothetical protein
MSVDQNPYTPPQILETPPALPRNAKQFAPCPSCGNTFATPVSYTWWGGIIGPKLLSHVTCLRCSTAYNGKSGKSNNTAITVYVLVSLAIGLAVGIAAAMNR